MPDTFLEGQITCFRGTLTSSAMGNYSITAWTDSTSYTASTCVTATFGGITYETVREMQARCNKEKVLPKYKKAYEKAEMWLLETLNEEQKETYEKELFFDVIGGQTRKHYRIKRGLSGVHNIWRLNLKDNKWVEKERMCFHPGGDLPEGDILLTQKMFLEKHEDRVLQVANYV